MGQGARAGPLAGSTSPRRSLRWGLGRLLTTSSLSAPAMNRGASNFALASCSHIPTQHFITKQICMTILEILLSLKCHQSTFALPKQRRSERGLLKCAQETMRSARVWVLYLFRSLCNGTYVGGQASLDNVGDQGAGDGPFGHHADLISQFGGPQ